MSFWSGYNESFNDELSARSQKALELQQMIQG
jgi:hypothetical protein